MAVIRNLTGSPIALDDLGITVPASGDYDLSQETDRDIRKSIDLITQINAGNLVFLDGQGNQRTVAQSQDYLEHQSALISAITVQQNGINIPGTPHNTLNFDSFLVFNDAGSGVATIKAIGKTANSQSVTQNAHGFVTGNAIYLDDNDGLWKKALANSASTLGIGIADVVDVNNFNVIFLGNISGLSGLVSGNYYFVSSTVAGNLVTTEPVYPSYSNPLLLATSTTEGIVIPFRPSRSEVVNVAIEQGKHTMWLPAGSMIGKITGGADFSTAEVGTSQIIVSTYDFDPNTTERVQFTIAMPKSWDEGVMSFQFYWTQSSAGTGNVIWSIRGTALSDTNPIGTATWGTAVSTTDAGGTTNLTYISSETGPMTIGNTPAENDMVVFEVFRDATNPSDTLTVDAKLIGVKVFYFINAPTDA